MNAILVAVFCMLLLSICRVNVVISLIFGAFAGGLVSHLSLKETLDAFNAGISNGAAIALSYALLGAFAVAISHSGLPNALTDVAIKQLESPQRRDQLKWLLIIVIGLISISSQNILPIHIAFIPLLIPPLLYVMSRISLDRRAIACVIAFGLITPYMFLPVGFGNIFLNQILLKSVKTAGLDISHVNVMKSMAIPALGMFLGLLTAIFISYAKPRTYVAEMIVETDVPKMSKKSFVIAISSIILSFAIQLYTGSIILGALFGFVSFIVFGIVKWNEADEAFNNGIKMMAMIGFVIITAQGFAEVLRRTGDIQTLVHYGAHFFAGSKATAALTLLLIGLVITIGIGSSFSTVPILAVIFVPLCSHLGFSPQATVCLIASAGVVGDSGSPCSDSSLAITAGLNADGQQNHIKDTVIPTFLHFNIPLLIAAWIATVFVL